MNASKTRRVLIASLAGALTLPGLVGAQDEPAEAGGEKVKCYGVNKCKATGDCGGPGHSCANQNSCKRQGYIDLDKETCLRIDGGRLTPTEEKTPSKPEERK